MANELAVDSTSFESKVLQSDVPVLVDFWATWCRPCLAIAPTIEELASELGESAGVYKIDVDENNEIASQYGIMSIPALIVFKGGQEVERMVGAASKEDIRAMVERHI